MQTRLDVRPISSVIAATQEVDMGREKERQLQDQESEREREREKQATDGVIPPTTPWEHQRDDD